MAAARLAVLILRRVAPNNTKGEAIAAAWLSEFYDPAPGHGVVLGLMTLCAGVPSVTIAMAAIGLSAAGHSELAALAWRDAPADGKATAIMRVLRQLAQPVGTAGDISRETVLPAVSNYLRGYLSASERRPLRSVELSAVECSASSEFPADYAAVVCRVARQQPHRGRVTPYGVSGGAL